MTHTIILIETTKNKIIGGYTPMSFNPVDNTNNLFAVDNTKSSFIFSLTNNDKF